MIEKTPLDHDIIVVLGYKGNVVQEYCEAAHPDRNFTFVTVDKYEGEGSSLAYSLLLAKKELQCPYIFNCCDALTKDKGNALMEEMQKNHDEWWNSLTDKQKQQLFEEQEAAERERLEEMHEHTIWDEWGSDIGDEDMDEGLYKDKE